MAEGTGSQKEKRGRWIKSRRNDTPQNEKKNQLKNQNWSGYYKRDLKSEFLHEVFVSEWEHNGNKSIKTDSHHM